jgi:uncharacterized protein (DUF952 family)
VTEIYKIATAEQWRLAEAEGVFRGAPVDLADGYIHFSTAEQVASTLQKWFAGQRGLLLVAVTAERFGTDLRWEPARGGALFPHLYAPLPTSAANRVAEIPVDSDGRHVVEHLLRAVHYERYVAIGDSSTEGLDDPDGRGNYRGWADRLAEHVAVASPGLLYANLAVRGRSAGEILETQLAPALAMKPDLATVVAGMNDLLRSNWSAARVASQVGNMVGGLRAVGATVITFTIPDVSRRMRLGRALTAKTDALNVEIRAMAERTGALLLDLASYELAHESRLWAADRIHGNPEGHTRIAAALAHLLGLPGATPGTLTDPLPHDDRSRTTLVLEDVAWVARFVAPWAVRRLRGKTTGDGRFAKRPQLTPVRRPEK